MINYILRLVVKLILSVSSFSGVLFFYTVSRQDFPGLSLSMIGIDSSNTFLIRNIFYVVIFGIFAYISLLLTKVSFKPLETLSVNEIKPIESVAVPTYIGLFVIAIGLESIQGSASIMIMLILFLFWRRLEKIFYFNPIWLFFGYRFYEIKSIKENTYTLVTKDDQLKGKQKFEKLRRINNYTFLEIK